MASFLIFLIAFIVYTTALFWISYKTSQNKSSNSFFLGERKAPWPIIAYGMVGASISGVTFISVPGNVMHQNFYYIPLVIGFAIGYIIIAKVLLPIYYKMELTSIYSYLGGRFGQYSHWTGAVFFMISRLLGSAVRVYIVIVVLYTFIPKSYYDNPFLAFLITAVIFLILLFFYTYKGGVKTIIWTDFLQTTFMLLSVILAVVFISKKLEWNFIDLINNALGADNPVTGVKYSTFINLDWKASTNIVKQILSGTFICVAMTGLDQSMMQKNIACKDLRSSQKNIYTTASIIVAINVLFLSLGAILSIYVENLGGMTALGISKTDEIFSTIASDHLGIGAGVLFLIGLISASYSSVGISLTSLTTSYCLDFLRFDSITDEILKNRKRIRVQLGFTVALFLILIILFLWNDDAVINLIYKLASYTYGPLLGIFFFGILTKRHPNDKHVPLISFLSPFLCLVVNLVGQYFFDFALGFSLLIVNGAITFFGLYLSSMRTKKSIFFRKKHYLCGD